MSAHFNPMQAKVSLDLAAMKWHADTFQSLLSSQRIQKPGISAASWVSKSSTFGPSTKRTADSSTSALSTTIREYTANRPTTIGSSKTDDLTMTQSSAALSAAGSVNENSDGEPISPMSHVSLNETDPPPTRSRVESSRTAVPGLQDYEMSRILFTGHSQLRAVIDNQLNNIGRNLILHYERAVPLLLSEEDSGSTETALEELVAGLQQVGVCATMLWAAPVPPRP